MSDAHEHTEIVEDFCSQPVDSWVQNLRKDEDNPLYWDVLLRVGEDQAYKAHKNVLAASVDWFEKAFQPESGRLKDGEVKFNEDEVSGVGLQAILWFIYGKTVNINAENVWKIHVSCQYLQVDNLRAKCANFMCKNADILGFWSHATQELEESHILLEMLGAVIKKNFVKLSKTQKFYELRPEPLVKLFELQSFSYLEYNQVLDASLQWLNYDWHTRYGQVEELINSIQWSEVDYSRVRNLASVHELRDREECVENDQIKAAVAILKKLVAPPVAQKAAEKLIYLVFNENECKKWYFQCYDSETCQPRGKKTYFRPCICLTTKCTCSDVWSLKGLMCVDEKPHILVEIDNLIVTCPLNESRCRGREVIGTLLPQDMLPSDYTAEASAGGNGWVCIWRYEHTQNHLYVTNVRDKIAGSSGEPGRVIQLPPDLKRVVKNSDYYDNIIELFRYVKAGRFADDSWISSNIGGKVYKLDLISDICSEIQLYSPGSKAWINDNYLVYVYGQQDEKDIKNQRWLYIAERSTGREVTDSILRLSCLGEKACEKYYILPHYERKAKGQSFWLLGDHLYAFEPTDDKLWQVERLNVTNVADGWTPVFEDGLHSAPKYAIMVSNTSATETNKGLK